MKFPSKFVLISSTLFLSVMTSALGLPYSGIAEVRAETRLERRIERKEAAIDKTEDQISELADEGGSFSNSARKAGKLEKKRMQLKALIAEQKALRRGSEEVLHRDRRDDDRTTTTVTTTVRDSGSSIEVGGGMSSGSESSSSSSDHSTRVGATSYTTSGDTCREGYYSPPIDGVCYAASGIKSGPCVQGVVVQPAPQPEPEEVVVRAEPPKQVIHRVHKTSSKGGEWKRRKMPPPPQAAKQPTPLGPPKKYSKKKCTPNDPCADLQVENSDLRAELKKNQKLVLERDAALDKLRVAFAELSKTKSQSPASLNVSFSGKTKVQDQVTVINKIPAGYAFHNQSSKGKVKYSIFGQTTDPSKVSDTLAKFQVGWAVASAAQDSIAQPTSQTATGL